MLRDWTKLEHITQSGPNLTAASSRDLREIYIHIYEKQIIHGALLSLVYLPLPSQ